MEWEREARERRVVIRVLGRARECRSVVRWVLVGRSRSEDWRGGCCGAEKTGVAR
jgi:hypothetical protein